MKRTLISPSVIWGRSLDVPWIPGGAARRSKGEIWARRLVRAEAAAEGAEPWSRAIELRR